jgi:hypothetical protein
MKEMLERGETSTCYIRKGSVPAVGSIVSKLCHMVRHQRCEKEEEGFQLFTFEKIVAHGKHGVTFLVRSRDSSLPPILLVKMQLIPQPITSNESQYNWDDFVSIMRETIIHARFDTDYNSRYCPRLYAAGMCLIPNNYNNNKNTPPSAFDAKKLSSAVLSRIYGSIKEVSANEKFLGVLLKTLNDQISLGTDELWLHFTVQEYAENGSLANLVSSEKWKRLCKTHPKEMHQVELEIIKQIMESSVSFIRSTGLYNIDLHYRNVVFRPNPRRLYASYPLGANVLGDAIAIDFEKSHDLSVKDVQTEADIWDEAFKMTTDMIEDMYLHNPVLAPLIKTKDGKQSLLRETREYLKRRE